MQEKILMANTDLRYRGTEKEISQARQQLIKVDYEIRISFMDTPVNITDATQISRNLHQIICDTAIHADPLIGRRRQKVRTEKAFHRCLYAAVEETRQATGIALSHQYFYYLVPVAP